MSEKQVKINVEVNSTGAVKSIDALNARIQSLRTSLTKKIDVAVLGPLEAKLKWIRDEAKERPGLNEEMIAETQSLAIKLASVEKEKKARIAAHEEYQDHIKTKRDMVAKLASDEKEFRDRSRALVLSATAEVEKRDQKAHEKKLSRFREHMKAQVLLAQREVETNERLDKSGGLRGDILKLRAMFGRGSALVMISQGLRASGPLLALGFALKATEEIVGSLVQSEAKNSFGQFGGMGGWRGTGAGKSIFNQVGYAAARAIPFGIGTALQGFVGEGAADLSDKYQEHRRGLTQYKVDQAYQFKLSREVGDKRAKDEVEMKRTILLRESMSRLDAEEKLRREQISTAAERWQPQEVIDAINAASERRKAEIQGEINKTNEHYEGQVANAGAVMRIGGNAGAAAESARLNFRTAKQRLRDASQEAAVMQAMGGLDATTAAKYLANSIDTYGVNTAVAPLITANSQAEHQLSLDDRSNDIQQMNLNVARQILAAILAQNSDGKKPIKGHVF